MDWALDGPVPWGAEACRRSATVHVGGTFDEVARAEAAVHAGRHAEQPFVLVAHGTEADPVLNYGNATALALWEMSWEELTRTPSRLTAEAPNREERARLLATVAEH